MEFVLSSQLVVIKFTGFKRIQSVTNMHLHNKLFNL